MNLAGVMNKDDEKLTGKIVHLMQKDASIDAPKDSIQWAKNLFRSRLAEPDNTLVQKVLAVLQIDLLPHKAAFGERSATTGETRQLLFEAGDHRIDLRITKTQKNLVLAGQILGGDFAGAVVTLTDHKKLLTARANELSEFTFENISKGTYTLTLTYQNKEIIIENIEIG